MTTQAQRQFSPLDVRRQAHPECNAWCKGDQHAVVVAQHREAYTVDELMESVATAFGATVLSYREAPEAEINQHWFDEDGYHDAEVDKLVPWLCILRWQVQS